MTLRNTAPAGEVPPLPLKRHHRQIRRVLAVSLLFALVNPVYALQARTMAQPATSATSAAHVITENVLSPPALRDCDQQETQSTLLAAPIKATDARAYWISSDTIRWPNKTSQGHYYLYAATNGQLAITTDGRLSGASSTISLNLGRGVRGAASEIGQRFAFTAQGIELQVNLTREALSTLLHQQLLLVQEDDQGKVIDSTSLQTAGVLDELYEAAGNLNDLGVRLTAKLPASTTPHQRLSRFALWAPTAQHVALCTYRTGKSRANSIQRMQFDAATGAWKTSIPADLSGQYYRYLVDVFVTGRGWVRNAVTDPYSISLTTDSTRSYIGALTDSALKPAGWDQHPIPTSVQKPTDMAVYELHVRDFSANDLSVRPAYRGKYVAFTETQSNGMRHLSALGQAGITDIHLLPVFDITSVPEAHCDTPTISGSADSEQQQATISQHAATDCFNWGYDPYHYNAPEGSYATNAADGATRVIEFRKMVMALHQAHLRVGMDVVYNHTAYAGQHPQSVLDRVVPGYYHRRDAQGKVEESTCQSCGNTATEHRMMAKLLTDSVRQWAYEYKIDSFRFDLMGHQPRAVMEQLKTVLALENGHPVQLIGEGWNFGEVANNARFVQASQLSLNGSGIGTFSDRARDAIRGPGRSDDINSMMAHQGYINGLVDAPNAAATVSAFSSTEHQQALMKTADMVRVGLAGTLRDVQLDTWQGRPQLLKDIDYNGQPAGYASEPDEVVNYVENHDNQTLFDINAFRLPVTTSHEDRARVQIVGLALTAFSQGIAYFHAGTDILRSKSLDGNSYNSGDWFNRLDWTYQDNYFGTGLPSRQDNEALYPLMRPLLTNTLIKPRPEDIAWTRDTFRDLLRIRQSTSLFHLATSAEIQQRLHFYNTGPSQNPAVIVGYIDGVGLTSARWKSLVYLVNASQAPQHLSIPALEQHAFTLHPVHLSAAAGDKRIAKEASFSNTAGFVIPARSAVVFVEENEPRQ